MARKDYVRNSAPKRRPANKKSAPARQPPWAAIAVFCVCALAFGFLLYKLAQRPAAQAPAKAEPVAVQPKEEPKTQPKAKDSIPKPPKEEWRYVETLKNKEVEVEVPDRPKDNTPYQMQCGSFKVYDQAEAQKAKLAFAGMEAQVRKTGDWYRVILGPYTGKRAAQNDQHKAEKAGLPTCAIWPWR
ncbi:SPOR domain-containing protein [Gallaecimonas kandeliae]|uniref:SPOR domain-containing protein n=1 Tax=Gallaecimonas kandeliae TaxID=3029055 RepID=UPI00264943A3|nr:SPOR domain-containing protein [Gallaecimonas kandeliae]WKE65332.1 SPOR domain-containing protein [Gallaecimonas kandeliae]